MHTSQNDLLKGEIDMKKNRILEICHNYFDSPEYNRKTKKMEIDLSWIENELKLKDFLKLEEAITDHVTLYEEFMFQTGFIYAWELFTQCKKKEKNIKE